jgi:hypothetical protein
MYAVPAIGTRHHAALTTRRHAAQTLLSALQVQSEMTESTVHSEWQSRLTAIHSLMPEGWYQPPPTGTSVLIGQPPDFSRTNFRSLRNPINLPRRSPPAGPDSMLFVYCSPIDRVTAMIGDFQMTIYRGNDAAIRHHLAAALRVTLDTAAFAQAGMELRELYFYAAHRMAENDIVNDTHSVTDRSGLQNIGHTIPWSYATYGDHIWTALATDNTTAIAHIMRHAISPITQNQTMRIANDMAFTIEPQVISGNGVQASFHALVDFRDATKTIHTEYSKIFAHFGMSDWVHNA